mmetsp:Transcript_37282/g.69407  ORF Transcript_37282/g.69407 Transcript_37282/m.69407 type:complete len:147 (-) Transcript_37282:101-541(-)
MADATCADGSSASMTRPSRSLRGGASSQQSDSMLLRVNRNFRTLLQEGSPSEILGICERSGKHLNIANVAAALQTLARAEDGSEVAATDSRFSKLVEIVLAVFSGPQPESGSTKELAITAWAFAKLGCAPHVEALAPAVLYHVDQF